MDPDGVDPRQRDDYSSDGGSRTGIGSCEEHDADYDAGDDTGLMMMVLVMATIVTGAVAMKVVVMVTIIVIAMLVVVGMRGLLVVGIAMVVVTWYRGDGGDDD
eukprot:2763292-Pyramimonas_sp.AAC.1